MATNPIPEKQQAYQLIDRLAPDQLTAVVNLLQVMALDPFSRKLALAPLDDEPVTPEEAAAIQAGAASLERNGGVPMEEVLADFGLTMDDLRQIAESPLPEELQQ